MMIAQAGAVRAYAHSGLLWAVWWLVADEHLVTEHSPCWCTRDPRLIAADCSQGLASGPRHEPSPVPELAAGSRHLHVRTIVPVPARTFQDLVGSLWALDIQPAGLQHHVLRTHVPQV